MIEDVDSATEPERKSDYDKKPEDERKRQQNAERLADFWMSYAGIWVMTE